MFTPKPPKKRKKKSDKKAEKTKARKRGDKKGEKKSAKKKARKKAPKPPPEIVSRGLVTVDVDVPRDAVMDINVPAAIMFRPRDFVFTGTRRAFMIERVFVANGPNEQFGAGGYPADLHDGIRGPRRDWPTFYNSPPLTITVRNVSGGAARFAGVFEGEHVTP